MDIICECGNSLIYEYETIIVRGKKITKTGNLSKRSYFMYRTNSETGFDCLSCEKCGNSYAFDMDSETKKVIRGSKY